MPPDRAVAALSAALAVSLALAASAGAQQAVEVAPLAAPDLFSAGTGAQTGLGPTLWQGSSGALAREVIGRLEPRQLSVAGLGLARRVLATGASGPDGAGNDPDVAGARALALLGLGDAPGVLALIERSPGSERSEPLARAAAQAALITGASDRACAVSRAEQRDGWWLRLRAYCLARSGDTAGAQLAYNLAVQDQPGRRVQGEPSAFARLMAAPLAAGAAAGAAAADDALDYALSREAQAPGLAAALASASAPIQAAVARDETAPADARAVGAAYALRLALIGPELARAVYAAAPPAAASPPAPAARRRGAAAARPAPRAFDALAEAARFRVLTAASDQAAKVDALADLLGRAESAAAFSALARLTRPELDQLSSAPVAGQRAVMFAIAAAAAADPPASQAFRVRIRSDGPEAVPAGEVALVDAIMSASIGQAPRAVLDALADRGVAGDAGAAARAQAALALMIELAPPGPPPLSPQARARLRPLRHRPGRRAAGSGAGDAAGGGRLAAGRDCAAGPLYRPGLRSRRGEGRRPSADHPRPEPCRTRP